jgi:hypothetical protein
VFNNVEAASFDFVFNNVSVDCWAHSISIWWLGLSYCLLLCRGEVMPQRKGLFLCARPRRNAGCFLLKSAGGDWASCVFRRASAAEAFPPILQYTDWRPRSPADLFCQFSSVGRTGHASARPCTRVSGERHAVVSFHYGRAERFTSKQIITLWMYKPMEKVQITTFKYNETSNYSLNYFLIQ